MSTLYKGHDLNEHQANELENHLLYKFAYDRGIDIDDFHFMADRGYAYESLIRRATMPGMPVEIRWPYKNPPS